MIAIAHCYSRVVVDIMTAVEHSTQPFNLQSMTSPLSGHHHNHTSISFQSGFRDTHYVPMCQDVLPPHPSFHTQRMTMQSTLSHDNSASDSEISTTSLGGVSALSESSELRALFPSLYQQRYHVFHYNYTRQ